MAQMYGLAAFCKREYCVGFWKSLICIRPVLLARGPWPLWEYAHTIDLISGQASLSHSGHQISGAILFRSMHLSQLRSNLNL
jgi:hypothetical protein